MLWSDLMDVCGCSGVSYYYFDGGAGVWAIYTENPDSESTWSKPVGLEMVLP